MDLQVRPVAEDEIDAFVRAQGRTFGMHAKDEDVEAERWIFERDRTLAVFDGDRIVGGTMGITFRMTVPGGASVPTGGVTSVGVQPTHRRRGILTSIMREQLHDVHERGEPLAALEASESGIYGRFGYGMAEPVLEVKIERAHTAFAVAPEPAGSLRLIDRDEALRAFPPVYEALVAARPGAIARTEAWWRYSLADLEHHRDGASELFYVLLDGAGGPEGYAFYRIKQDWEQALPAGVLQIEELVGLTPTSVAQLWRFCLDVDLVARIHAWHRPPDEPLHHLLADPRRLDSRLLDGTYVRTVDVPAALSARTYAREDRLVLEIADPVCPWNEGRFALDGGPDGAQCAPTTDEPDLRLDATALGAAYLGGVRFSSLAGGLRVHGEPPALARADAMFASDVTPWNPLHF